jgi:hypothetical protein
MVLQLQFYECNYNQDYFYLCHLNNLDKIYPCSITQYGNSENWAVSFGSDENENEQVPLCHFLFCNQFGLSFGSNAQMSNLQ